MDRFGRKKGVSKIDRYLDRYIDRFERKKGDNSTFRKSREI